MSRTVSAYILSAPFNDEQLAYLAEQVTTVNIDGARPDGWYLIVEDPDGKQYRLRDWLRKEMDDISIPDGNHRYDALKRIYDLLEDES